MKKKKLNPNNIITLLKTLPWVTKLSMGMLTNTENNLFASSEHSTWEEEKEDILERANYLCDRIIKSDPEKLMQEAPDFIGREYQGEWAIYCCSMLTHALTNISYIYPDKKEKCPGMIAKMIDLVNTPTIREYDTNQWKEDAMESLDGPKHHMTYLSILAWMISNYKMAGRENRYDDLFHKIWHTLNPRMLASK